MHIALPTPYFYDNYVGDAYKYLIIKQINNLSNNMKQINYLIITLLGATILSCGGNSKKEKSMKDYEKGTFGYDLNYLQQKENGLVVLSTDEGKSQIGQLSNPA